MRLCSGATLDETSWRSRQLPFYDVNGEMNALAKEFKTDHGIQCEHESRKGSVETVLAFSKRMVQNPYRNVE